MDVTQRRTRWLCSASFHLPSLNIYSGKNCQNFRRRLDTAGRGWQGLAGRPWLYNTADSQQQLCIYCGSLWELPKLNKNTALSLASFSYVVFGQPYQQRLCHWSFEKQNRLSKASRRLVFTHYVEQMQNGTQTTRTSCGHSQDQCGEL